MCVCVWIYIYIYIYIERERERERELLKGRSSHLPSKKIPKISYIKIFKKAFRKNIKYSKICNKIKITSEFYSHMVLYTSDFVPQLNKT